MIRSGESPFAISSRTLNDFGHVDSRQYWSAGPLRSLAPDVMPRITTCRRVACARRVSAPRHLSARLLVMPHVYRRHWALLPALTTGFDATAAHTPRPLMPKWGGAFREMRRKATAGAFARARRSSYHLSDNDASARHHCRALAPSAPLACSRADLMPAGTPPTFIVIRGVLPITRWRLSPTVSATLLGYRES